MRNTAITASSWKNRFNGPYLARLHLTRNGRYMGAWMTTIRNSNQWLQVALGRPMTITGIATQGNPDTNQWVRQYVVAFSQDKMHFEYYMQFGNVKVCGGFGANSVWTLKHNYLFIHRPVFAKIIMRRVRCRTEEKIWRYILRRKNSYKLF